MFPPECLCSSVYSVVWIAAAISAEWLLDDWTVTIRVEPFFVGSENFPRVSVSEALLSPRSRSSGMPALRVPGHTNHSRWSTPTSSSWCPAKIRGKPFFPQALCLTLFWWPPPPHTHTLGQIVRKTIHRQNHVRTNFFQPLAAPFSSIPDALTTDCWDVYP